MIRPVIKKGDERLLVPTVEVSRVDDVKDLVEDLWETLVAIQGLYDFTRGSGLSANQIGYTQRVSVVEFDGKRYTLINPHITEHSDKLVPVREGCLSFFDYRGMPLRYSDVTVEAITQEGEVNRISSNGNLNFSSILQHELGHLDGELYDSHLSSGEELTKIPGMPHIP